MMATEKPKKAKFVQFAVILEVEGNVNADESVGTRTTIKKFITRDGIYPYVSSRAIKKGIRLALERDYGFKIDPFEVAVATKSNKKQSGDSGNFLDYIDQDLFGYMVTITESNSYKRKAPVELSYLVSFFPIPISVEFAGRFPKRGNPVPFEIEQAKFLGRFYGIIYNYVGIFHKDEVVDKSDDKRNLKNMLEEAKKRGLLDEKRSIVKLGDEERKRRLKALMEIIFEGKFTLPRATNQLNQGNYKYVIIALTNSIKPLPAFVNIKYQKEREFEVIKEERDNKTIEKVIEKYNEGYELDMDKIKEFVGMLEDQEKLYIIDYVGNLKDENLGQKIKIIKPSETKSVINDIIEKELDLDDVSYYLKFYGSNE